MPYLNYAIDGTSDEVAQRDLELKPQSQRIVRHFVVTDPKIICRVNIVQTCPKYSLSGHKSYDTLKIG